MRACRGVRPARLPVAEQPREAAAQRGVAHQGRGIRRFRAFPADCFPRRAHAPRRHSGVSKRTGRDWHSGGRDGGEGRNWELGAGNWGIGELGNWGGAPCPSGKGRLPRSGRACAANGACGRRTFPGPVFSAILHAESCLTGRAGARRAAVSIPTLRAVTSFLSPFPARRAAGGVGDGANAGTVSIPASTRPQRFPRRLRWPRGFARTVPTRPRRFYPYSPREGRLGGVGDGANAGTVSIPTLRSEGDMEGAAAVQIARVSYSRPSFGGRRGRADRCAARGGVSIFTSMHRATVHDVYRLADKPFHPSRKGRRANFSLSARPALSPRLCRPRTRAASRAPCPRRLPHRPRGQASLRPPLRDGRGAGRIACRGGRARRAKRPLKG